MWFVLSLINAIGSAGQNAYYKKITLQLSPIVVLWSVLFFSSLLFSPLFFLGIPHIGQAFIPAIIIRLFIDTAANLLYIKGISKSPLSLTIPMLSLSPLCTLIASFFINHLTPSLLGLSGILIVVSGIYYLNFDQDTRHILSPFKAIYKEKGVLYVAITAVLWGIVTSLMKLGIDNSSPSFYTALFQVIWLVCLTPLAFFMDKKGFLSLFKIRSVKKLLPLGVLDGIQLYAQNLAFALAQPVYVNTVSQTSILFSSLLGWLFFKEKIHKHLVPTIIIVIGIILITLAQK